MNKIIKIAESFDEKLIVKANSSDSQVFAKIINNYENMVEVIDVILEGLQLNIQTIERDETDPNLTNIIKEQAHLIESALMSVYPQVSELDAKLYEILST